VIACSIAMARGATIEGEITVTGDQPILEYEEKRAPAAAAAAAAPALTQTR
jgi:hypothetical protein